MILEIEYYKGNTLLFGKTRHAAVLREQLKKAEQLCDKDADNFIEFLCRAFGWTVISSEIGEMFPDYTYDRDTWRLYKH